MLYEAINGMAPSEEMDERNTAYLAALADNLSYEVYTGWRTWFAITDSQPSAGANASMFTFKHYLYEPMMFPVPFDEEVLQQMLEPEETAIINAEEGDYETEGED